MVIAEALNERKTLFTAAKEVATQLTAAAIVEQKNPDTTADEIRALLDKFEQALDGTRDLTVAINQANNREQVRIGNRSISLMEAIALRDTLTLQHRLRTEILTGLDQRLGKSGGHYGLYNRRTKKDVKEVSLIDRDAFRKENDGIAEERRLLDIEIQKVNWSADL